MCPITPFELDRMRRFSESQMLDMGRVLKHTEGTRVARGQPTVTYEPQSSTRCTFVLNTAREALSESTGAAITDATVYLPQSTQIGPQDRFQLTHRFGQALVTPITYVVIGQPAPDMATLKVSLRAGEASQ